jgi:hypothetical protein
MFVPFLQNLEEILLLSRRRTLLTDHYVSMQEAVKGSLRPLN